MAFVYVVIFMAWFVSAALVGYAAQSKGQNGGTAMAIAMVLSPMVGFLWVISLPDNHAERRHRELLDALGGHLDDTVPCPRCSELIMSSARICRFCRLDVEPSEGGTRTTQAPQQQMAHVQSTEDAARREKPAQDRKPVDPFTVFLIVVAVALAIVAGVSQLGSSANSTFTTISGSM